MNLNPEHWWQQLSGPWKAFVFGGLLHTLWMALSGVLFEAPVVAVLSSLLWGAAAGSSVRLYKRVRRRRPPR